MRDGMRSGLASGIICLRRFCRPCPSHIDEPSDLIAERGPLLFGERFIAKGVAGRRAHAGAVAPAAVPRACLVELRPRSDAVVEVAVELLPPALVLLDGGRRFRWDGEIDGRRFPWCAGWSRRWRPRDSLFSVFPYRGPRSGLGRRSRAVSAMGRSGVLSAMRVDCGHAFSFPRSLLASRVVVSASPPSPSRPTRLRQASARQGGAGGRLVNACP